VTYGRERTQGHQVERAFGIDGELDRADAVPQVPEGLGALQVLRAAEKGEGMTMLHFPKVADLEEHRCCKHEDYIKVLEHKVESLQADKDALRIMIEKTREELGELLWRTR
jgi:hypothetical protein